MKEGKNKYQSRRDFVRKAGKVLVIRTGHCLPVILARKISAGNVWQIDPFKCTQCGQCKTNCVLTPSAVKCVHALCNVRLLRSLRRISSSGSQDYQHRSREPVVSDCSVTRKFVEEPYFEYTINEDLCDGCGKCVKGCADFGNGSLYLQINQDLCVNCNECAIARKCPSNAIVRVT